MSPPSAHPRHLVLVVALLTAALLFGMGGTATAAPAWAPVDQATIHPGVMTTTAGGQCTANFIYVDGAGVYVGQAAHCSGTGAATETDGCLAESRPLGTAVEVEGAEFPGELVYNSWLAMQAAGETDPNACAFNDLALVRLDPRDHAKVNPSIPVYGGPTGVTPTVSAGETVYSYQNSSLRGGVAGLSPKTGTSLGQSGGGWTHSVYTVTPGIPGDSGSGFVDADGRAFGVLSTLALLPLPASNGVSDLARMLDYAAGHSEFDVVVADGTEAFSPAVVGLLPVP